MRELRENSFIPLSKYWTCRLGFLDIINNERKFIPLIDNREDVGDDLKVLIRISKEWNEKDEHIVGEAGTLFRFLQYASWKFDLNKKFVKERTLKDRNVCDNPEIVNWPVEELIKLDDETTQWGSARILCDCVEEGESVPDNFFLNLSKEALQHYKTSEKCELRHDETLFNQAETFLKILKGEHVDFKPIQPDDYCFARAFGFITKEEGEKRWPELKSHESHRLEEMEKVLNEKEIDSRDHRVIQAISMKALLDGKEIEISNPNCVSKSWPRFWDFIDFAKDLK